MFTDRLAAAKQHLDMSVKWKGERQGIMEMRRHYGNYFKGISHFKEHRMNLVTSDTVEELNEAFDRIEATFDDSTAVGMH